MVLKTIRELIEIKRYQRRNEAEQTALLYMILEELKRRPKDERNTNHKRSRKRVEKIKVYYR